MIDPNVPSYFLIILCGFGAVWSYRFFSKKYDNKIYEFEYVAFSTLWGSLIFLPILIILSKHPKLIEILSSFPFIATPALFILGVLMGLIAVGVVKIFNAQRKKQK
jgi:hypothetical protein